MNHHKQKMTPKKSFVFSNSQVRPNEALTEIETISKVWENTGPMSIITNPIIGMNISNDLKEEGRDMIWTKRIMSAVNIFAILICIGLLFNRASMCVQRYIL